MKCISTALDGVKILEPRVFYDTRGSFCETYNTKTFKDCGISATFVQDNESLSHYGVIRGLHFQTEPFAQAKLVRAIEGEILDVVLDIRPQSSTFGKHISIRLSEENRRMLFIPKGFAHGFATLSREARVLYKCDELYAPQAERSIFALDTQLAIDWTIPENLVILSEKDGRATPFRSFCSLIGSHH